MNGFIGSSDEDHITVSQEGDRSSSPGCGYTYEFLSNGSASTIGPSSVLGSNASKFSVLDAGANGGCVDYGIKGALVTSTALMPDKSNVI